METLSHAPPMASPHMEGPDLRHSFALAASIKRIRALTCRAAPAHSHCHLTSADQGPWI